MAYLILYLCLAASPTQVLLVDGYGASPQAALSDAKRKAVEQGVGVVISSKAVVENFRLIDDQILARADGFLKRYREIESSQKPDGTFAVKIEAEVTAILDEITRDKVAIDLLLQWLHKPRFIFLIDEDNVGDTTSVVAETEIGRLMAEKGFPVFSSFQQEQIRKRAQTLSHADGNYQAAMAIANEFPAEYLVLGKATATITDASDLLGQGWISGKAYISAKVIKTELGEILSQNTFEAAEPEINKNVAGAKAIKKAAAKLADYLIKETIRKWAFAQSNTQTVSLRVSGVTRSQMKKIESFIQTGMEGIQSVFLRSFSMGSANFSLEISGDLSTISDMLDGKDFGDFSLQIVEETRNSITAQTKVK